MNIKGIQSKSGVTAGINEAPPGALEYFSFDESSKWFMRDACCLKIKTTSVSAGQIPFLFPQNLSLTFSLLFLFYVKSQ
jgi:hypothetical protein